jgi:hypothetical protein
MLDVAMVDCKAEVFREALYSSGFIILRSAIEPKKISYFRRRVCDVLDYYGSLTESDIAKLNWRDWWPGSEIAMSTFQAQIGCINDRMLQDATKWELSFYDLISDPRLHVLKDVAFPGVAFLPSMVTHCRRVALEPQRGWSNPVSLHCDTRYHRDAPFALNFWTPLEPAGDLFRSPGLEIWPLGFDAVSRYLEFDLREWPSIKEERFSTAEQELGPGFRTSLDVGDLMVFTSWTLHRTYVPRNATKGRLSAEVRLKTDHIPFLRTPDRRRFRRLIFGSERAWARG